MCSSACLRASPVHATSAPVHQPILRPMNICMQLCKRAPSKYANALTHMHTLINFPCPGPSPASLLIPHSPSPSSMLLLSLVHMKSHMHPSAHGLKRYLLYPWPRHCPLCLRLYSCISCTCTRLVQFPYTPSHEVDRGLSLGFLA